MEELDIKQINQIPIPSGLEQRLSQKIDEWERQEMLSSHRRTTYRRRTLAIAASLLIVGGIGLYLISAPSGRGTIDTYNDPELAYAETERALLLLAENLNKGIDQCAVANEKGLRAKTVFDVQMKSFK